MIMYLKRLKANTTTITFTFPDGQTIDYKSENIILENFTKEEMIEKKLFPYIPFYLARYEKELTENGGSAEKAIRDLLYFREELFHLYQTGDLSDNELVDLMGLVNTIIVHITNGNQHEERLVKIMGGTVLETQSEKWIRQGREQGISQGEAKMLIEMSLEYGLDNKAILERLQERLGLSLEQAVAYLQKYGKES